MSFPRKSCRATRRGWGGRGSGGFTLLEVALVLLVTVLASWLGLLLAGRGLRHVRTERLIADLQTFGAALQDFRRQQGAWPPSSTGDAAVPRGMEKLFAESNWSRGSPFGGNYGWISPGPAGAGRPPAGGGAITLTAFSPSFPLELTRAELIELDRRIDDGDLATGRLRTGFNGWPVCFVAEKP